MASSKLRHQEARAAIWQGFFEAKTTERRPMRHHVICDVGVSGWAGLTDSMLIPLNTPDAAGLLEVAELRQRVVQLEERLQQIDVALAERPVVAQGVLRDLQDANHELIADVEVVVESYSTEVVARWQELELYGSGSCEAEALVELKRQVVALYDDLAQSDAQSLGAKPQAWKRILSRTIRRV